MSELSQTEMITPDSPLSPESCPISELLGKRVVEMSDEELNKYVTEMRTAVESPQSMRKLLGTGTKKTRESKKESKTIDLGLLGL